MATENPAWRVKTQPCSYYAQGRCLFGDSCNFLHSVGVQSPDATLLQVASGIRAPHELSTPKTNTRSLSSPPSVTVDSPHSARSSIRSPRLSKLLLALKGVIGTEDEDASLATSDASSHKESGPLVEDGSLTPGRNLTASATHGECSFVSEEGSTLVDESGNASSSSRGGNDNIDEKENGSRLSGGSATGYLGDSLLDEDDQATIRAPLSLSPTGQIASPIHDSLLAPLTPAVAQPVPSIPPTPTGSELSALLSPTELPNFPRTPFPRYRSTMHSVQNSISSDHWIPPSPIRLSPPPRPQSASTDDLIPSTFGSPAERASGSSDMRIMPEEEAACATLSLSDAEANVAVEPFPLESSPDFANKTRDVTNEDSTGEETITLTEQTLCSDDDLSLIAETTFSGSEYSLDDDVDSLSSDVDGQGEDTEHLDLSFHSGCELPADDGNARPTIEQADQDDETFFCQGTPNVSDGEVVMAMERFEKSPVHLLDSAHIDGVLPDDHTIEAESSGSFGESSGDFSTSSSGERTADVLCQLEDLAAALNVATQPPRSAPLPPPESAEDMLTVVGTSAQLSSSPMQDVTQPMDDLSADVSGFVTAVERISVREQTEVFDAGSGFTSNSPDNTFSRSISHLVNENDTIHSLYDSYSAFASPEDNVADFEDKRISEVSSLGSVQGDICQEFGTPSPPPSSSALPELCRSHTPSDTLSSPSNGHLSRGRIFTPPLIRGRAETITGLVTHGNGRPRPTLQHVLGPPFRPLSPLTVSAQGDGATGVTASAEDNRNVVRDSKKVPFGFRKPNAPIGPKSSPLPNRISRSIPPSLTRLSTVGEDLLSDVEIPQRPFSASPDRASPNNGSRLRPLRLASVLNPSSPPSSSSRHEPSIITSTSARTSVSSVVSSEFSLSNSRLLSSPPPSQIPQHIRNTLISSPDVSSILADLDVSRKFSLQNSPQSAPVSYSYSHGNSDYGPARMDRVSRRYSEAQVLADDSFTDTDTSYESTIRGTARDVPPTAPLIVHSSPIHAIGTPRPTLMFAIASDDVDQIRHVLESGEAGPNDQLGPQSALAFTLTNESLVHKLDIVKMLLAYGADPSLLKNPERNPPQRRSPSESSPDQTSSAEVSLGVMLKDMDPATRYYLLRAQTALTRRTSMLVHRSFFRPLSRLSYDLIGQDRAIEQLLRILSVHSQQSFVAPIVVLLCGASGHGKSLLARKFGSLLDIPTHTVNMTTLRSAHGLWQSFSMNPYEEPSTVSLAEFLVNNEGKRCIVVLDEIEKSEDEKTLWSLLMPWEQGRCSLETGTRHIDVRNVIWLGTTNIGHDLVFDHHSARQDPNTLISREGYVELMGHLRPLVSERLGASLLSRVTTVLPFVPFSLDEKLAIAAEAFYSLAGDIARDMPSKELEAMLRVASTYYLPGEGARSLYRAVSSLLIELI